MKLKKKQTGVEPVAEVIVALNHAASDATKAPFDRTSIADSLLNSAGALSNSLSERSDSLLIP